MSFKTRLLSAATILALVGGPAVATVATAGPASAAVSAPMCCRHSSSSSSGYKPKKATTPNVGLPAAGATTRPSGRLSSPRAQRSGNAPTNVGGVTSSHRATRTSMAPTNTGSLVVGGVARTAPVSRGAAPIPTRKVRVTGSTTTFGGARYRYEPVSYWQTHRAPLRGTPAYWPYLNDPYVYSNYFNPLSPWHTYYLRYHTFYVTGYTVAHYGNVGYFVPVSHGPSAGVLLVFVALAIGVILLVWIIVAVARRMQSNSGGGGNRRSVVTTPGEGWNK